MVKVSVIVPCYNIAPYLERCLDSLIQQTLTDIEIICINDKSTDNTLQILQEYAKKTKESILSITKKTRALLWHVMMALELPGVIISDLLTQMITLI